MLVVLFIIALVYFLNGKSLFGGVVLISAAFGLVFQRSDFGFSIAFSEFFSAKDNVKMRGILISLMVGIVGFILIKENALRSVHMFVMPAGWPTVVGGLIFGFGMVMADG